MNNKIPTLPAANDPQEPELALLQAIAHLPAEAGPPAHLDAAILNAAQRAVRVRPLARIRPWLSVAAAVFVAFFAVNLLQLESPNDSINQIQQQPAASPASKEMEAADDRVNQSNPQLSKEIAPVAAFGSTSAEGVAATVAESQADAAAAQSTAMKARAETPAAPKPAALKSELAPPAPLDQGTGSRPDPFPAAARARQDAAEEAKPDQTTVLRDRLAESEAVLIPERRTSAASAPVPPPAPAPAHAPARPAAQPMRAPARPSPPPVIAKEARQAVDKDAALGRAREAPESGSAESAARLVPSTLAPQHSKSTAGQGLGRSPSDWFAQMRQLLAAGDSKRAKAVLAEFRQIYPQAALPADLRALETD